MHIPNADSRIEYKICLLTWKIIHLQQPKMLAEIVSKKCANERLRNGHDTNKIDTDKTNLTNISKRRFKEAASEFNKLPKEIRDINELQKFKKALKTHICKRAYLAT